MAAGSLASLTESKDMTSFKLSFQSFDLSALRYHRDHLGEEEMDKDESEECGCMAAIMACTATWIEHNTHVVHSLLDKIKSTKVLLIPTVDHIIPP